MRQWQGKAGRAALGIALHGHACPGGAGHGKAGKPQWQARQLACQSKGEHHAMTDPLECFRKMLDPKNWPVEKGEYIIIKGEIYSWVTDHPLEEHVRKALFAGRLQ